MRSQILMPVFFVIGLTLGLSGKLSSYTPPAEWTTYALYAMILLSGISIGIDKKSWEVFKNLNLKVLLVPVAIIIGSLGGAALTSFVLPSLKLREILAVGAGLGYYSLSSIVISELHGEALALVALLSNLSREIITIVLAPVMVTYFGKLSAIASGGATSMDTTLPVIIKFTGKDYAVISVVSGVILTIVVPFVVTFILTIGA
jgi:uncharacterized membrane protein YbjE (DUF340 family)